LTKKKFQLRWVSGEKARLHASGEWQLHFANGDVKEYAHKRLGSHWLSSNLGKNELFYIFKFPNASPPEVLNNLLSAGIPKEEIEVKVPIMKPMC